ncbi:anti-phage dCTP deaminase [Pseudomonas aeruginosa]|uniref:anti-phage dCTP deaminase n=1 Tax=Pseudomonas aeruginosa TaxID=287 RepID=UPI0021E811DA|nr:anti-phage dCTP deaminase [Pseudomonas aeruginosa]MCV3836364.1 anti-phage dCTP deaminase [Pseudomonas aeruginosa]MDP5728911.1 anti-phage dCTP deaminase [Pseudomonas aeruginosa]HCI2338799.1 deoxycytidylate deaminase [Pseudomonas aeruginosa]
MAKLQAVQEASNDGASSDSGNDVLEKIEGRRSNEVVIAFCGAVGSNISVVIDNVKSQFEDYGYVIEHIKISQIIKEYFRDQPLPKKHQAVDLDSLQGKDRYLVLQDLGNHLRRKHDTKVLAALSMSKIAAKRISLTVDGTVKAPKTLYIIDQLKHHHEVELFRIVYEDLFYLVGVFSPEETRLSQLTKIEQIPKAEAQYLIERDKNEPSSAYGQKLEKTIQLSDYFISNSQKNESSLVDPAQRFVGLVHGKNGITPSADEAGMYAAYSASLKSACLSRQVGAAISNKHGNIISVGWNDVPKFGGGLYTSDSDNDQRCFHHRGFCYNDFHKERLIKSIVDIVGIELAVAPEAKAKIAALIQEETRAGSIIEYSRAIHAEMEAILGLARAGGGVADSCTLYTTTFPCHNCARHIIAAGIERVVYIEPYEKSLALDLHDDAITLDSEKKGMTIFENFCGVSPLKYSSFFMAQGKRKDKSGKAVKIIKSEAKHIGVKYIDPYQNIETKVVAEALGKIQGRAATDDPFPPEPPTSQTTETDDPEIA